MEVNHIIFKNQKSYYNMSLIFLYFCNNKYNINQKSKISKLIFKIIEIKLKILLVLIQNYVILIKILNQNLIKKYIKRKLNYINLLII